MGWLVATALRLRVVVIIGTLVLLIAGANRLRDARFDVFPEFAPPLVEIQTEAPGLSPAQVELLVTVPIENALNGVPWRTTLRSKSVAGLSQVVLFFEEGTDRIQARQIVQERLARVLPSLPAVADPPVVLSPISSLSRVLKIGLWSETLTQTEISTLARFTLRPRLMAVPGVANVSIFGDRQREIQVQVDPDRLRTHGVTLDQVVAAAGEAVHVAGGGFIEMPNQRLAVTHVPGVRGPEDLARAVVTYRNGVSLTLGEVAEIVDGFSPPIGDAIINDVPGLLLIVEKQPWANTLEVTRQVERTLAEVAPALEGIHHDASIFRPATFIEHSLANLNRALLIGVLLVVLVLAVFLYDWRSALISALAIPVSLVLALLVLDYRGGTIDTMVLAGLVIALGELVDDAIIDVENIQRRLRLNRELATPEPALRVVFRASIEVRSAVLYGSLIVVLVLAPVFMLTGLAGSFFRPLALAYVIAILASLLVALTLTPALCLVLLPRGTERHPQEPPVVRWLKKHYSRALTRLLRHAGRLTLAPLVALALTGLALPWMGEEFLPKFREYDFLMHWLGRPGTSLEAMDRITIRASRELRAIPGVRNFGSHIGRAVEADEVVGADFAELWVSLDPSVDYDTAVHALQATVDAYPGLFRDLLTYLRERVKEVLSGTSASIVVRVHGPDLDRLRSIADEVRSAISGIPGVADLRLQPQLQVPQIEVRLRPEAAADAGLMAGDVLRAVTTLISGRKVGEIFEGQNAFRVSVIGMPDVRESVSAVRSLRLDTPSGGDVPLADVADVRIAPTPNQITREAASRKIDVTCNVSGRDLSAVAREIEAVVHGMSFGPGYYGRVLGEYAAQRAARNRLISLGALSLLGIFLILFVDFQSALLCAIVLVSLPFALLGGVAGVFAGGGILSLGSLVGFVTILGIATRNGIMLISHYRHLRTEERVPFGEALVLRGAAERLGPILMTALTAGLALLPVVVGGIRPGYEIEHPMALVILGGLATSTLLTLFVLPALYLRYGAGTTTTDGHS